jgi:Uma2 family endonuclease
LGEKNIVGTLTIAVVVLSPSSARIDRLLKSARYAEGGVKQYWIVDPQVPSVEIFDLHEGSYRLTASGRQDETVEVTTPCPMVVVPAALIEV